MPKKIMTQDKNGQWSTTKTALPSEIAQRQKHLKPPLLVEKSTDKAIAKKSTKSVANATTEE